MFCCGRGRRRQRKYGRFWAKIGIGLLPGNSELTLTVRTPFFGRVNGVSLGFDKRQFGRMAFIECPSACESIAVIDLRTLSFLKQSHDLSVEYEISANRSAILHFDLNGLSEALQYLPKEPVQNLHEPVALYGRDSHNDLLKAYTVQRIAADDSFVLQTVATSAPNVISTLRVPTRKNYGSRRQQEFRDYTFGFRNAK